MLFFFPHAMHHFSAFLCTVENRSGGISGRQVCRELCERTLGLFHLFSELCCASEFTYVSQGVGPINPGALVHFELGMWFWFNPNGRSQGQVGHSWVWQTGREICCICKRWLVPSSNQSNVVCSGDKCWLLTADMDVLIEMPVYGHAVLLFSRKMRRGLYAPGCSQR